MGSNSLKLRGFFRKNESDYFAIIPSLNISQSGLSIDLAFENLLSQLSAQQIQVKLTLIEGNGFTVESTTEQELVSLILQTKCS